MNRSDALLKLETGEGMDRPLLTLPSLTKEKIKEKAKVEQIVSPKPGFCVKTKDDDGRKVFINICTSDDLPAPPDIGENELTELLRSSDPSSFKVPMSLGYPRMETDKAGQECSTMDVVINDSFYKKTKSSQLFHTFLITVIIEGLEEKHGLKLCRDGWVDLKNKKYFGSISDVTIRKKLISELGSELLQVTSPVKTSAPKFQRTTPDFILTKEPSEGKPTLIRAEIKLPGVKSVSEMKLQISEDHIVLDASAGGPKKYNMDVFLPIDIDPERVTATFIKKKQILHISLPCADIS